MEQEVLNRITDMIRSCPVTGKKETLNRNMGLLKEYLESRGLLCTIEPMDGLQILYASTVPGKNPDYLLNAHLDVVPPILDSQTEPVVRDGLLIGRGASDCLACSMCIAELLIRCVGKASVGAVFSMDEETGGETTGYMADHGYLPKRSIIIIDAAFGAVAYAQKGSLTLKLKATGRSGHSSEPWAFVNPIDRLVLGYAKLLAEWKNPTANDRWHDSMAATVIQGGKVFNQIPGEAELTVNFRVTSEESRTAIPERVREITGLEIAVVNDMPPVVLDSSNPELERMRKCHEAILGTTEIPLYRMDGATDAHHFSHAGVPILILGLKGYGCHTDHESLELDSFDRMLAILEKYVLEH